MTSTCAVLMFTLLAATAHGITVTPVTKVLQLLQDMVTKGTAEKKAEEVRFAAFSQWCDDQQRVKSEEITTADEAIEMLNARILKSDARIRALTDRVHELEEDVGRWTKDQKSASDVRAREATDYQATNADYSETIDAITQAIAVLKKQAFDRPQAEDALLQLQHLALIPMATKKALGAFLQGGDPDEQLFYEAPEAHAYSFQSGGVIDMLEKLKGEFDTKINELNKEEQNAMHAFEQITQSLVDDVENANHEAANKRVATADTQRAKAEAKGTLAQTTADRAEDEKYLGSTKGLCSMKKADFESRQKLRAGELEALQKAVEIISSQTVAGAADNHLPALMQIHRGHSALVLLRSSTKNPVQDQIAAFLAERAQSCNSKLLALIAQKVSTDPFDKIKKMIKDLISKLMEESTAETEHKGWCDTELVTNLQTRNSKTVAVNKLTADIEELSSNIAQLTQDAADLAAGMAELDAAMAKATADRTDSKATNEATVKESKEAQMAVENAIAILKDYYAKSAEATAFVQKKQTPEDDAPETFDGAYKGQLPEGGSVVDFLQVILSDFARLEAETSSTESSEQEEYDKYMFESKKDRALKENEKGHKENTRTDKESALHAAESERRATQEQLDKAVAYYEKLKPSCVDSGITYEERVKRREEEIQSLQEALKILAGTDIA